MWEIETSDVDDDDDYDFDFDDDDNYGDSAQLPQNSIGKKLLTTQLAINSCCTDVGFVLCVCVCVLARGSEHTQFKRIVI